MSQLSIQHGRMVALAALALPACTLLFQPSGDVDGGGGRDGSIARPEQTVVRITNEPSPSRLPSLAAGGGGFLVVWSDRRPDSLPDAYPQIYAAKISAGGAKVGDDRPITTSAGISERPALVFAEDRFRAAWEDGQASGVEIFAGATDLDGTELGDEVQISSSVHWSLRPAVAWTGTALAVAWSEAFEIYLAYLEGDAVGERIPLIQQEGPSPMEQPGMPALAWTGDGFGAAWEDRRTETSAIYFVLLDAEGARTSTPTAVTDAAAEATNPSLAWTGTGFVLAWQEDADGNGYDDVHLLRLRPDGEPRGYPIRVSRGERAPAAAPSLVWAGSDVGVAWHDARHGPEEIYFARIDPEDEIDEVRVTATPSASTNPSLAWDGSRYGLAWEDRRDGREEIYFTLLDP